MSYDPVVDATCEWSAGLRLTYPGTLSHQLIAPAHTNEGGSFGCELRSCSFVFARSFRLQFAVCLPVSF